MEALFFCGIWIGCGIVAYFLLRLAMHILNLEMDIKYPKSKEDRVWTWANFICWMSGCLVLAPIALLFGVFGVIVYYGIYVMTKAQKNGKGWWSKKAPF